MAKKTNETMTIDALLGLEQNQTTTSTRSIPMAAELQTTANTATDTLLKSILAKPELADKLKSALNSGSYEDMTTLVEEVGISTECTALESSTEGELKRMLESRRSDRSKAKKTGLNDMAQIRRYISATIAEMMLRKVMNFEYKATGSTQLDIDTLAQDQEALNRKIRSLQSKASILKNKGAFAPEDWEGWAQLEETKKQIAELQARRTGNHTVATKTVSMSAVKNALAGMTEEQIQELLAQAKALQEA